MAEPRILVVDDEVRLAHIVASYLEAEGYETSLAYDGVEGLDAAKLRRPDVAILDIMLPGLDGLELCRRLREVSDCYIIMLTARDGEADKLEALSHGADDYLVKPFSPRELVARVKAMLRRPRLTLLREGRRQVTVGSLSVDTEARSVAIDGAPVDLTRTEFEVMAMLAARPNAAITRRQLIEGVWGPDWYGDDHILDVHVGNLRRKLADNPGAPRFIRTVRGVGYSLGTG